MSESRRLPHGLATVVEETRGLSATWEPNVRPGGVAQTGVIYRSCKLLMKNEPRPNLPDEPRGTKRALRDKLCEERLAHFLHFVEGGNGLLREAAVVTVMRDFHLRA